MSTTSSFVTAVRSLHYGTPPAILLSFAAARVIAACFLHGPSKGSNNFIRRNVVMLLLLGVLVTVIAQAVVFFAQSLIHHGYWAPQDDVVFILASVICYGVLVLALLETKFPVWYPYGVSCFAAAMLETSMSVLGELLLPTGDDFAFARLALQVVKCLLLILVCLSECWHTLNSGRMKLYQDNETEPLLRNDINGSIVKPGYGTARENDEEDEESMDDIDSDEDEPGEFIKLKKQQKKRLQDSGSWLNYLKEFKIFVPMLWPSKNRFVQLCLLLIAAVLVAERFLNVLVPRQLGIIIDELTTGHGNGVVPWAAVSKWMVLSYLNSQAGIYVVQALAELPVQQYAYKRIGAESFQHIMNLSMDFHNEKNSGELIRAIDQGQNLQGLLEFGCFRVPPIFIDMFVAFIYVYLLFDVYMSLILIVVGFAYIWVGAKTTAWSIKRRRRYNTTLRYEGKVQQEAISNWQTVSHFNRGHYECEKYGKSIDDFNAAEMSYFFVYELGASAQTFIMVLGRLASTFLAVYRVAQGAVPVGHLVTLTAYWRSIESPLAELSWSIRRVTQMLTDSERLLQLFQTKPTVYDAPNAAEIHISEGHVEFECVEFAYDARRPTLKDVSFVAKPGQTIALVGETGGGKSTILKLLYRYYDVSGGAIRIDGQDIRGVTLDSLRDSFGMVPQDPALFNVSLMENLRYGRLDATDEEVKQACHAAAIHDKIESFPEKYESKVGERGVKLSGGELQRVAIARAILRQPKIVLLDEATSMIDAETEATIQKAFRNLSASRTTFVIAHRLSTIQHADLILVIHNGQIVERGSHDELFQHKDGKYVALWSKQLSKEVQDVGNTLRANVAAEPLIELDIDTTDLANKRDGPNRGEDASSGPPG